MSRDTSQFRRLAGWAPGGYTGAGPLRMATIEIADFAPDGVSLTSATSAGFDARAQAILGDHAAIALEMTPYLAIVRNDNPRTVVAYTVEWTATLRNDTNEISYTQFKFPDAVAGTSNGLSLLQGRELRTGQERLLGMGFEVWPPEYADRYRDFGVQAAMRLGEVKHLRIALDAAIFDDGVLLGPDHSRLAEHFIEFVHAKQTIYRDIVVGLENGDERTDVLAPIREVWTSRHRPKYPDSTFEYRHQASGEVLGFHNRVMLEVFLRTLRREPFVIKRLSGT